MPRAFVQDLWLIKADPEGRPVPSAVKRTLSSARDPMAARIPEKWKTSRFGQGKRWRVKWGVTDPRTGVKSFKSKAFEKFADADEFKAAVEDDLRAGKYRPPVEPHSFSETFELWMDTRRDELKEGSWGKAKANVRRYATPVFGEMPLQTITGAAVEDWVAELKARPLSNSTITATVCSCRGALRWAIKRGWRTGDNPFDAVSVSKKKKGINEKLVFLTPEEVNRLANAASEIREEDGLLIRFLALTGVRIGEAIALRVADVDFTNHRASITKTWTLNAQGREYLDTPKSGHPRKVAFPPLLEEPLKKMVEGRAPEEWFFMSPRGSHTSYNNWRVRVWNPSLEKSGLGGRNLTPHVLRHTFTSWAVASGADVKTVQNQLGHANAAMTLNVYACLWPDNLDTVSAAVGKIFEDGSGSKDAPSESPKTPEN